MHLYYRKYGIGYSIPYPVVIHDLICYVFNYTLGAAPPNASPKGLVAFAS